MFVKLLHLHLYPFLLLLFTLFQPIVCLNGDTVAINRRDRSSFNQHTNDLNDMPHEVNENPSIKSKRNQQNQQQQLQQQLHSSPKVRRSATANDSIFEDIFYIGPEHGVKLFNNTLDAEMGSISDPMQADGRLDDNLSEPPFKVQRSPDGKLNLVFNPLLFLQRTTEAQTTPKPRGADIIFPDQRYKPRGTEPSCEDGFSESKPFCTKVRNYPRLTQLDSILTHEFAQLEAFFGEDWRPPLNVTQRMNIDPDEEFLCDSKEKIIYPEAGLTKDSNWLLIVNNNEKYKQGVRIEECSGENQPCKLMGSLPNHYRATCKQNYVYRNLVALTANGTVTKDQFKMPSCCKCVLKQVRN